MKRLVYKVKGFSSQVLKPEVIKVERSNKKLYGFVQDGNLSLSLSTKKPIESNGFLVPDRTAERSGIDYDSSLYKKLNEKYANSLKGTTTYIELDWIDIPEARVTKINTEFSKDIQKYIDLVSNPVEFAKLIKDNTRSLMWMWKKWPMEIQNVELSWRHNFITLYLFNDSGRDIQHPIGERDFLRVARGLNQYKDSGNGVYHFCNGRGERIDVFGDKVDL